MVSFKSSSSLKEREKSFKKKLLQVEKACELKIKNLRPVILDEARDFLRDQGKKICSELTNMHQNLL